MTERLTPDEDHTLRVLAELAEMGALSGAMCDLYEELRSRDRRATVRPVSAMAMLTPREAPDPGPLAGVS